MALQRLYSLDDAFVVGLDGLLRDERFVEELHALQEPELSQVVDHLDETVARLNRTGRSSRKCLQVLRRICAKRNILPSTFELSKGLLPPDRPPIAQGELYKTYEGTIDVKVSIKRLMIFAISNANERRVQELFWREAIVWKHLVHPNIVPLKGVTLNPPQLVSEWMPGGEIRQYARANPELNLVNLLLGVANGLAYLHSYGVIHGNLKGPSIMVDGAGNARVTDFGLAKLVRGADSIPSTSDGGSGSLRWTAPEILERGGAATMESDVYSFGVVMIEVFTGEVPFKNIASSEVVMHIINGKRPKRPSNPEFTDNLWGLTQQCWIEQPKDRPKIEGVANALTSGKLPDISPAPPGATAGNLTMVSPGLSAGGMPPISSMSEGQASPYLLDGDNAGSDLSPPAPTKVGKDSHPTHTVVDRNTMVSFPGRPSGSNANGRLKKSPGGGEGQDFGRLKKDDKCVAGMPSPVSQEPSSSVGQNKMHGIWCRVWHFLCCA